MKVYTGAQLLESFGGLARAMDDLERLICAHKDAKRVWSVRWCPACGAIRAPRSEWEHPNRQSRNGSPPDPNTELRKT